MRHAEQDALAGGFFRRIGPSDTQLVSSDLDEASVFLEQEAGPPKYEPQGRTKPFFTRLQFRKLRDLALGFGWFAPAMLTSATLTIPYYTLIISPYGSSMCRLPRRIVVALPSRGAFWLGIQPVEVRTKDNCHIFGTRFSPGAFQLELSHLLGRDIVRPIEFHPIVNFEHGAGRIVKRTLARIFEQARQDHSEFAMSGLGMRQVERSLITLVLEGLSHNYSKIVNGPERKIAPWQVRAVEEFILENAGQPLSLGDLAVIGGVSARSLQYTFRRHRGCSPMEFLWRIRLERVRNELVHATPGTTVTYGAMRWGFLHLGRFAAEYRATFNESPSETLRRSLGRICPRR